MIKRYNGTAWNAVTYCKNFNGTEQFTYFPVVANTFANAISSWTIKGNEQHTGTPAPGNPIRGVGEETANLYNYAETVDVTDNKYLDQQGVERSSSSYQISYPITVEPETEYTWQFGGVNKHTAPTVGFYDSNDNLISAAQHINAATHFTFTTPSNCDYVRASVYKNSKSEAMLSKTSTAIPFEPYGYKIPISFGQGTYTSYLAEPIRKIGDSVDTVPSTGTASRVVKKYVFTGDEDWVFVSGQGTGLSYLRTKLGTYGYLISDTCVSSHYVWNNITSSTSESGVDSINSESANMSGVAIRDTVNGGNATTYKRYLADQYAAGTPVTVWVVLASAETETFTAPTIPTSGSPQSFDVDTTLKPSEVSLTYHGWHEHQDTKYSNP